MSAIATQLREVSRAAGIVGDDDPNESPICGLPDLGDELADQLRVAEAGYDDRDRPSVALVPASGGDRFRSGSWAKIQETLQRRQPAAGRSTSGRRPTRSLDTCTSGRCAAADSRTAPAAYRRAESPARLAAQPPSRVAERLDERSDEPQHPPTVHEHLIQLLGLFTRRGCFATRLCRARTQDPRSAA